MLRQYRDKYKYKNKYKHKYRDNLVGSCELGGTSGAEHRRNGDVCYISDGFLSKLPCCFYFLFLTMTIQKSK